MLVTAAGLLTIGFGIPINAFSLGNTLIISGTIATVGGLMLIGLAAVLGQLRRIGDGFRSKAPSERRREGNCHAVGTAARTGPGPSQPPLHETMTAEPLRAPEPPRGSRATLCIRAAVPATASEPSPGPLDWLRAKSKPVTAPVPSSVVPPAMSEPPMVELTDEAPLSPRSPQRPPMPPAVETALEPKVWSPNRDAVLRSRGWRRDPNSRCRAPLRRSSRRGKRRGSIWYGRIAAQRPRRANPGRRSGPRSGPTSTPRSSSTQARAQARAPPEKREPAAEMPLPPIPARPREIRPASERRMPEILRKPIVERDRRSSSPA